MKVFYKIEEGEAQTGSGIIVPDGFVEYVVGQEPEELQLALGLIKEAERVQAIKAEAKAIKLNELDNIVVEVNNKLFDGNDKARLNMLSAIQSSEVLNTVKAFWKLADNTVEEVTVIELKEALAKSIQRVGEIVT